MCTPKRWCALFRPFSSYGPLGCYGFNASILHERYIMVLFLISGAMVKMVPFWISCAMVLMVPFWISGAMVLF